MKIGPKITADLSKLIDSKLLIQANSGGGKSWAIRRILEQSHGKVQQIILDPEGEFGTLREKYEYILCGKDQDAPADVRSAALLARKLLEVKTSAIIDLYELHPQDRKKFVRLFLEAMINAPKDLWHPVLVVIDEAHTFAPEKGESEALNAVIGLASLGRKRGFGAVLATQRISKLHKDAAAECNNKLIGRTGLDIDRKRAGEELGFSSKEDTLSLRTLEPGEFYAFGPAISSEVIRGIVGEVETSHPKAGSRILTNTVPPTDKIKKILAQLADLPQEAKKEAETIQSLKTELSSMKMQLSTAGKFIVNQSPMGVSQWMKYGEQYGYSEYFEKRIVTANDKKWQVEAVRVNKEIKSVAETFRKIRNLVPETLPVVKFPGMGIDPSTHHQIVPQVVSDEPLYPSNHVPRAFPKELQEPVKTDSDFRLSSSQQKILNSLLWTENLNMTPADKSQIAFLSDQSPTSSGYTNNLSQLRTRGLINYPSSGTLILTEQGRSMAQESDMPTTNEELHDQVLRKLSSSQQAILKVLLKEYPNQISKTSLAELAMVSPTSSGYTNNLSKLRTLKLVDYPSSGSVIAQKLLFIE